MTVLPPPAISVADLNLDETLHSGQAFHWQFQSGFHFGCIGDQAVWMRQHGDQLQAGPEDALPAIRHYLRLDEDHRAMLATFPVEDTALAESVAFCPGLRILRQPLWECLASFITSSLKQVVHIGQISLTLRKRFGKKHHLVLPTGKIRVCWSYPTPEAIAVAGEKRLRRCGLGYRAVSMHRAAEEIASGRYSLEALESLSDEEARVRLCELHGVGEKIANCVLLFGLGRLGSFPVDVWIERVLRERYFDDAPATKVSRAELEAFAARHFGPYGGYAQQFLFHHARKGSGWRNEKMDAQ